MKTALITGAASGIGLAVSRLFGKSGFKVIALDREKIRGGITYDLTDLTGIPKLIDSLGRIDVLVNNAGVQTAIGIDKYTGKQRARVEQLMKVVYTGRKGRPEEAAEAIRWLAMDAPEIINGAVIDVTDGCFLR